MKSSICCHGCGGRKQVSPLGGIPKDCAICNGIGYVMIENDIKEIKTYVELKPLPEVVRDNSTSFRDKREQRKVLNRMQNNT